LKPLIDVVYSDPMTQELEEVAMLAQELADRNGGPIEFGAGIIINGYLAHLRATVLPSGTLSTNHLQLEPWHKPPMNPQPPRVKFTSLKNEQLLTKKEYNEKFSRVEAWHLNPDELRAALRSIKS